MNIDDTVTTCRNELEKTMGSLGLTEEEKKVFLQEYYNYIPLALLSTQFEMLTEEELDHFNSLSEGGKKEFQDVYVELVEKFPDVKDRILTEKAAQIMELKLKEFGEKVLLSLPT